MAGANDRAIAALAVRQHGHVTRRQLVELGLNDDGISYRIRIGRLHRVHRGVYAVGHRRRAAVDRAAAAVLACGPGAVLSHFAAAALWGFVRRWPDELEVAVDGDRRPNGITIHRCPGLTRQDKTRQEGIPVTTPARTVLDCAPGVPKTRLPRFVNDAFVSNYLTPNALTELLQRNPSHQGTRRLAPYANPAKGLTRSELEDDFVAFIERFGLPMPELNVPIDGRVVDAFFRQERLIVEIDGYQFHKQRAVFEKDRDKDADAAAEGLQTLRITKDRMANAAEREARRLEAILRARRPPP